MYLSLYKTATRAIYLFIFPLFFIFSSLTGSQKESLAQRQGRYPFKRPQGTPRIWLHAASVGEVQVIRAILPHLQALCPQATLLVSTLTETGHKLARETLEATCFFAPLDAPGPVRRALDHIRPHLYVAVETELWPNLLTAARAGGARLLLINGRLSARSTGRYQRLKGVTKPLLQGFTTISCISAADRDRYQSLSDRQDIEVTGNAKYDLNPPEPIAELARRYRQRLAMTKGQRLLILGSTHTGEEEQFLAQLPRLQAEIPGLVTLIAPRHLQRVAEVAELGRQHNQPCVLYSKVKVGEGSPSVIILDSMGELSSLYAAATYIFCGGSLVAKGGHNIFEGAIMAKPVFIGPHMADFRDAVQLLGPGGGLIQVNNCQECVTEIIHLACDQSRYDNISAANRTIALAQQGAARRQAEIIAAAVRTRKD
ncbi:MAG: glycosyltransferase N-terminal domain-containing protein [Thermodesulfobacteriota bacterium]